MSDATSATQQPEAVQSDGELDEITRAMTTPEFYQNPYVLYARMRREHPVYRSTSGIWYLTRYAEVEAALHDLRLSNDRERMTRALATQQGARQQLSKLTRRLGRVMTNTDPPDHTRLRKLVNSAFTARRIRHLRPRIQEIVDELLDAAIAAGPTMDLITALAAPLPITVICELFGIPGSDREWVNVWFRQLTNSTEGFERVELAVAQLEDYLTGLIRRRRAEPADDLISAQIAAQERGDQLTDEELLSTCFVLLTAGDATTTNLIGNGMLAVLRHPGELRRLQQDPTLNPFGGRGAGALRHPQSDGHPRGRRTLRDRRAAAG